MVERILGIDLGIASLGWAVVEHDKDDEANNKIVDCGVRLFSRGVNNDNESLAKNRRDKRLTRRRLKRTAERKEEVRNLCVKYGLSTTEELDGQNYAQGIFHEPKKKDVWQLRRDALYSKLADKEFARVLVHLSAHRGFKFLPHEIESDDDKNTEDKTDTEKKASLLMERVQNAQFKTIGEYRWEMAKHSGLKRFKKKKDNEIKSLKKNEKPTELYDWQLIAKRDDVLAEAKAIFEAQRSLGNEKARIEFETEFCGNDKCGQLMWVEDPQSIEDMVGHCKYFPEESRVPKHSPTAEKFVALTTLLNCRITDWQTGLEFKATDKRSLDELLAFIYERQETNYEHFRVFLDLKNYQTFKGLLYTEERDGKKVKTKKPKKHIEVTLLDEQNPLDALFLDKSIEGKRFITRLTGTKKLQNTLGDKYNELNSKALENIAFICSVEKTHRARLERFKKELEDDNLAEICSTIEFSAFNELSLKAIEMILPEMLNGKRYDEAINLIGLPSKPKNKFIPAIKEIGKHSQPRARILNPAVLRAMSEFRKVANALVRKYGNLDDNFAPFHRVYFELPRDFLTIEERKREYEKKEHNKDRNDAIDKILKDIPHNIHEPKQKHREAYKLWEQQGEICPYCQSQLMHDKIFAIEGYAEIDHILPRSRSFDNSFQNKILVHNGCNQNKQDRTPYEWLNKSESQKWQNLKTFLGDSVLKQRLGQHKIGNLLKENFDDAQSQREFSERNLNDTSYICKAIKDFCEEYWELAPLPSENGKKPRQVAVRNGRLTSFLRYQWGVTKSEDKKDRDFHKHHAEDAIIVAMTTEGMANKLSKYYRDKETMPKNKAPKMSEPIQNIRAEIAKKLEIEQVEDIKDKGITVKRLLVSRPPRAGITCEAHDGTIYSPKYKTVKKQGGNFDKFGNKKENGGYQYIGNGELTKAVVASSGIAKNGEVRRWDIFKNNNKYEFVPIYPSDITKNEELPNRSLSKNIVSNMDESFCFSMFKNDLLSIKKADNTIVFGYYLFMESDGRINIEKPEGGEKLRFSALSSAEIKKYTIDPLGYYHEVKNEKRLGTIPQMRKSKTKKMTIINKYKKDFDGFAKQ
jgi:CRISPR-associated endonuclease Csn1